MAQGKNCSRWRFLGAMSASLPTVLLVILGIGLRRGFPDQAAQNSRKVQNAGQPLDVSSVIAGDDAITFRKHTLDLGPCEAVNGIDINTDGVFEIIACENWYEQVDKPGQGLQFIKHKFREIPYFAPYVEDLGDLVIDVNGDGYPDLVTSSVWSKPLAWWENPGASGGTWREHIMVTEGAPIEFSFLVDLLNSGKPLQLLPQFTAEKSPLVWYELAHKGSADPWIKHEISPRSYGHGIGAGDVNGDGRTDVVTPKGWFEAPSDPRNSQWAFHPDFELGATGFIYTEDLNGDGLPDLVTSLGHDYGIFWCEQKRDASGRRSWVKHLIDDGWSQAHAMTLVDLNEDGRRDLVTGKRYKAHEHDPGANEPLGVYWYEALQTAKGLQWKRHVIDYSTRAGGGIQIPVMDIDRDGDLDIIVAGRSGLFLFENLTKSR
jgi:hypothetical protein